LIEQFKIEKQNATRSDKGHYKCAEELLKTVLGKNFPADKIKAIDLFHVRNYFNNLPSQKDGRLPSRKYVNKIINYTKGFFRWGADTSLLQSNVLSAMGAVKPLKYNQGTRETIDRREISKEVVNKSLFFFTPTLIAMVQIQGMHGFRPSEVCNMKVSNFDLTHYQEKDGYVIYSLRDHKTAHSTGEVIKHFFYKPTMDLILPYLKGKNPDDYIFSPLQHWKERAAVAAKNRKSKISPLQRKQKAEAAKRLKERKNDHWEESNYARAIKNTIKTANKKLPPNKQIPLWTPYQLRYAFVSNTSELNGTDRAQTCIGHKTNTMTQHYDKSKEKVRKNHFKDLPLPFAIEESESVKSESEKSA
jgi:integrase